MTRFAGMVLALFVAAGVVGCGDSKKTGAPDQYAPKPTKGPTGADAPGAKGKGGTKAPKAEL